MNTISFSDFQRLTENVNYVPIYSDFSLLVDDIIDAVLQKVMKNNVNGFNVILEEDGKLRKKA